MEIHILLPDPLNTPAGKHEMRKISAACGKLAEVDKDVNVQVDIVIEQNSLPYLLNQLGLAGWWAYDCGFGPAGGTHAVTMKQTFVFDDGVPF